MRCDAVDKARAVESKSFEIIELPEPTEHLKQSGSERGAVDAAVGADRDQAQGWLFSSSTTRKRPSGNCCIADGS